MIHTAQQCLHSHYTMPVLRTHYAHHNRRLQALILNPQKVTEKEESALFADTEVFTRLQKFACNNPDKALAISREEMNCQRHNFS